jgi:16S rRNA (cytosine1402-N4)-methyltransferase
MAGESNKRHQPNDSDAYHIPVLLKESIDLLEIQPSGTYVDCTFGGGGHSREVLQRLNANGRLYAFDQDLESAANVPEDPRITFIPQNFRHVSKFLRLEKITSIDGLIADLGVSSHQFNEAERGFSYRFDADLDMRMDKRSGQKASDILNSYSEEQLQHIFQEYGEVTNAKTLAKSIVTQRASAKLTGINQFLSSLRPIVRGNPNKYFAQVFQALRIEVNDEIGALKELLEQAAGLLHRNGRIAIITFHSLEDRLVKNFFKHGEFEVSDEFGGLPVERVTPALRPITKKPVVPSDEEMKLNPRSRSAKLRVAEKI